MRLPWVKTRFPPLPAWKAIKLNVTTMQT